VDVITARFIGANKKMTNIEVSNSEVTVLQAYGGLKEIFFEVEDVDAADVLDFSTVTKANITDGKICVMQNGNTGAAVTGQICGNNKNTVVVGSGPSANLVTGILKFRDY